KRVIDQNGRSPSSTENSKIRCGMTDTSSQGEKKDTKRATSCEVALSKRLGWGSLNLAFN
ncbi:hypothetical protein NUK31_21850, partial [Aeromonas caviae]|uniref:hypothetical protein n=1 Tax=Aeromonas caviae TaxID=648 RepID=UPI00214E3159